VDPKTSPVLDGGAASSFHREKKGRSGELFDIDYSEENIPPKETMETEEDGEEEGEEEDSGVKQSAAAHVQQPLVVQAFYYSGIVL
jgi:hypothetical protein